MSEEEKDEIKIKLLFIANILLFIGIIFMLFKIIENNNQMAVWMLEHGGIK